jgi:hypothetical protein
MFYAVGGHTAEQFSIVTCYGLDHWAPIPKKGRDFSLYSHVETDRPTQSLIQWILGTFSLERKWSECEADHSLPPTARGVLLH